MISINQPIFEVQYPILPGVALVLGDPRLIDLEEDPP